MVNSAFSQDRYSSNMLFFLFFVKLFCDLFLKARGFNFVVLLVFALVVGLSVNSKRRDVSLTFIFSLLGVVFVATVAATISGDWYQLVRWVGLFYLFYIVDKVWNGLSVEEKIRFCKKLLLVLMVLFSGNLALTYRLGLHEIREMWNFEHVNLAGSYLLPFLFPAFYLYSNGVKKGFFKWIVSILVFLTTSTGATVLALFGSVYGFAAKKKSFLIGVVFLPVFIFLLEAFLRVYAPESHAKLFSPFAVLNEFGMAGLADAAIAGLNLYDLGPELESSLTWRFVAYSIFINDILNRDVIYSLFGYGFGGHGNIWGGYMPHNDFLLVILDMGLIGFSVFVYLYYQFFKRISVGLSGVIIGLVVVFRCGFENNLYSFYVMSTFIMLLPILFSGVHHAATRSD